MAERRVLVVNAGSTSLKLSMTGAGRSPGRQAELHRPDDDLDEGLARFLDAGPAPDAVGHRVVHGGQRFAGPTVLDADVRRALDTLTSLAPLHNPPALEAIDVVSRLRPTLPAVVCFDTAFHHRLPPAAATYALPESWRELGVRRFGFHGLSCAWSVARSSELLGRAVTDLRLLICHLGGGASVTAVAGGRSMDTSMGFTPNAGLVMATRSGDVDPGVVVWLQRQHGVGVDEIERTLEGASGLVGLSGSTGDLRALLEQRTAGDASAALAIEVYEHRLVATVAAMAAATAGTDAVVFTGGVGEHAADIRAEVVSRLQWLGLALDPALNNSGEGDRIISPPGPGPQVLVVEAREDLIIADETRRTLGPAARSD